MVFKYCMIRSTYHHNKLHYRRLLTFFWCPLGTYIVLGISRLVQGRNVPDRLSHRIPATMGYLSPRSTTYYILFLNSDGPDGYFKWPNFFSIDGVLFKDVRLHLLVQLTNPFACQISTSSSDSRVITMNIAHSLPSTVTGVSFSFLTSQDIRRISVKQIVNPVLLDDLNRPNIGGLYDPSLGPSDRSDVFVLLVIPPSLLLISLYQLCFMSPHILYMSWSLWAYRTTSTSFPSVVHGQYVQSSSRGMYVLPQIQNRTVVCWVSLPIEQFLTAISYGSI